MYDAYVCDNPSCGTTLTVYMRFCPNCGAEKSMQLKRDELLKRFLTNIVTSTRSSDLDTMAKLSGIDYFNLNDILEHIQNM